MKATTLIRTLVRKHVKDAGAKGIILTQLRNIDTHNSACRSVIKDLRYVIESIVRVTKGMKF
jgi:hypothetical protein